MRCCVIAIIKDVRSKDKMAVTLEKIYKVTFAFALVENYKLEEQTWLTKEMLKSRLKRTIVKYFYDADSARSEQVKTQHPLIVKKNIQPILTFQHENKHYEIAPSSTIDISTFTTKQTIESYYN